MRDRIIEVMARAYARSPMDGSLRERMDAALTALQAEGMTVVPREPTEAMLEAGEEADAMYYEGRMQTAQIYKAMLAAHTQEKDA